MTKNTLLKISNLVAIIATLIMNGLSNNTAIFPQTMAELGEKRAIFFLPSGYVFAIWGVIYILLIGFVIYQFRPIATENGTVERVGWWFVLSCIANGTWLWLFLYDRVWLSTIAMLVLLGSLLMIYRRLQIGERKVDWQQQWAAHIPFSVYLGWISVATVANFSAALYEADQITSFLGIGADIWAVIMMTVAGILGFLMLWRKLDIAYALVIVWALIGIYARPFDTPLYDILNNLNASLVNTAAIVVAIAVAVGAVGFLVQSRLTIANRN
jgi:hypothetical protein